jgi:hypothetical protein
MANPKKFLFSPDDFNEFHVLKIPFLLYLVLIYLNKYFLLVVLPSIGGGDLTAIVRWFKIDWLMMISCLPALALLVASLYRIPTPKKLPKLVWEKGRLLLLISSALDFVILASYVALDWRILDTGLAALLAIDVAIAVYLLRSNYLKEMFKEFPEEVEKK